MKNIHFLNGQFVDEDHLLISPRELGYSRGYAAFDFMITKGGRPFMMDRHIDRLFNSCQAISLIVPWSKQQVADWIQQTVDANELGDEDMVMRIIVSGGTSGTLTPAKTPTIVIVVEPRIFCPLEDYANGVRILLTEFDRYEPHAKTTNYVHAVRILKVTPDHHKIRRMPLRDTEALSLVTRWYQTTSAQRFSCARTAKTNRAMSSLTAVGLLRGMALSVGIRQHRLR